MGFLSGVLGAVKNTQTYNVGKNTLNLVSNEITKYLCSGHDGFTKLLPSLTREVGKYNTEVRESNDKVKKPIEELLKHLEDEHQWTQDLNKINVQNGTDEEVQKADKLVEQCKNFAKTFDDAFKFKDNKIDNTEMKNAIRYLNNNLSIRLTCALKAVSHETQRLEKLTGREKKDFDEMIQLIKSKLEGIQSSVRKNICERVTSLVTGLKNVVKLILEQLRKINVELKLLVKELQKWIQEAKECVNGIIKRQVEDIKNEVTWSGKGPNSKWNKIENAATELRKKARELFEAGEEAKQKVQEKVTLALEEVKAMDEAIKGDLKKVKDAVNQKVTGIKEAIGKLYKVIESGETDDASDEEKTIVEVIKHIQQKVKDIHGGSGRDPTTGLQVIRNKVNQYVKKYGNDQFGDTAEGWMKDIWGDNVVVRYWLGKYLGYDTNKGELPFTTDGANVISGDILRRIADTMKQQLNEEVIRHINVKVSGNIQTQLTAIESGITSFIQKLGRKITKESSTLVSTIARQLESVLVSILKEKHPKQITFLESAVHSTLVALNSVAKQAWSEIHSFALLATKVGVGTHESTSIATEIDKVFGIADTLFERMRTATNAPRGKPASTPSLAAAVDNAIEGVTQELGKKLKGDTADSLTFDANTFNLYNGSVKQDAAGITSKDTQLTGTSAEGSLPAAIGAIKTKVEEALKSIGQSNDEAHTQFDIVTRTLSQLCGEVKRVAKEIEFLLGEFNAVNISATLQSMYDKLNTLQSKTLDKAIKDTEAFINRDANQLQDDCISELHGFLDQQVLDSQNALTTLTRKQYVSSIKELLTEFAKKVHRELERMPHVIDNDLTKGFKGFMKSMETKFIATVRGIESISPTFSTSQLSPLSQAATKLKESFTAFVKAIHTQEDFKSDFGKIKPTHDALTRLLNSLETSQHFDHLFSKNWDAVDAAMCTFTSKSFGEGNSPLLLESLKKGILGLMTEFHKAYVSRYSGIVYADELVVEEKTLTEYGKKCAKVFLTILKFYCDDLNGLQKHCAEKAEWRGRQIYASTNTKDNALGDYLKKCGYVVADNEKSNNGELQRSPLMKGEHILNHLNAVIQNIRGDEHLATCKPKEKQHGFSVSHIITCLFQHANEYFCVTHLPISSAGRHPSSIYDMLRWLCGLTYHPVYDDLSLNAFSDLFEKKEEPDANVQGDGIPVKDEKEDMLEAHPANITALNLREMLTEVCHYSYDVLVSLVGHGHAGGIYACDFNTNPDKLSYPSNSSKCLDLLTEICLRLFHQLSFLYKQCTYPTQLGGWLDCHYGRDVGGSNWICNTMQCPNQKAGQTHNQTCDQKCKQTPKCGLKSPLQSFLEDGLPGFMPHPYGKSDCKMKCDAPNHFGKPCKTPMGFADLTTLASINGTGKRIKDVLHQFCGKGISPLTKLCGDLLCLLQRPPQTLGDMFAFYYRFIYGWGGDGRQHRLDAFNEAVAKAHFEIPYDELDVHSIFKSTHSSKSAGHTKGDLLSLVCSTVSNEKCGLYLSSISNDISGVYSSKYADKYLSWIVYITETFYDLLKKLFDDCKKHCGGDKPRCRIAKCPSTCTVTKQPTKSGHADSCNSIANCKTTLPTLCRYGFTIGNPSKLSGKGDVSQKRTCNDFCNMLGNVVKEGNALHKLAHEIIPEFLFKIRAPFIWLTLALWLLSLLYLLHIMVIRLDLLHIKSHLHSPSSHRIAAQSLLAAGRVNKLNRVFYLQP